VSCRGHQIFDIHHGDRLKPAQHTAMCQERGFIEYTYKRAFYSAMCGLSARAPHCDSPVYMSSKLHSPRTCLGWVRTVPGSTTNRPVLPSGPQGWLCFNRAVLTAAASFTL
jgi:hypothetical protein